jgi:hypothetical protein
MNLGWVTRETTPWRMAAAVLTGVLAVVLVEAVIFFVIGAPSWAVWPLLALSFLSGCLAGSGAVLNSVRRTRRQRRDRATGSGAQP